MESKVVSIIVKAFTACTGWLEDLITSIPGAKTAIFWAIFVGLIMSFMIIPIRGVGVSLATGYTRDFVKGRKKATSKKSNEKGGK